MRLPKMLHNSIQQCVNKVTAREPDKVIGERYLRRWYVIPRNRLFNVYVHRILDSDPDHYLHDHPWLFNCSLILEGKLTEELRSGQRVLCRGSFTFRGGRAPHRLLLDSTDSLTLFITGPKTRSWGFYTQNGWVNSKSYLKEDGNGRSVSELMG